jgi:hypothetical protein
MISTILLIVLIAYAIIITYNYIIIGKELNFSNDTINEFKDMGYTILETIVII